MFNKEECLRFIEEENVKFIRLAFFDAFGTQKNIAIQPDALPKAFEKGISFDRFNIKGFDNKGKADLFLFPDPSTLTILPWRSMDGAVIRLYCDIKDCNGNLYREDSRNLLKEAVMELKSRKLNIDFATQFEFYLFHMDDNGIATKIPIDHGTYMDVFPKDKGENIRREICFSLSDMGLEPKASHHEKGPGQNEIDFRKNNPLQAADDAQTFKWVVRSVASLHGLEADFSPKPLEDKPGNGVRVQVYLSEPDKVKSFIAGILVHIEEMTLFFNSCRQSYDRLNHEGAPKFIACSSILRNQLIRYPQHRQDMFECQSFDSTSNPYLSYMLLIYAGLDGIDSNLDLEKIQEHYKNRVLPTNLEEAMDLAKKSYFIKQHVPESILKTYLNGSNEDF